jgi:hypothetical protein
MDSNLKISTVSRQKIPSRKVDIVQNLALQDFATPRKTHISGHFHLITPINIENQAPKSLIF